MLLVVTTSDSWSIPSSTGCWKVVNDQAIHIQLKTVGLDSPEYLVGESGSVVFTNGQYQVVAYPFIEGFSQKVATSNYCRKSAES